MLILCDSENKLATINVINVINLFCVNNLQVNKFFNARPLPRFKINMLSQPDKFWVADKCPQRGVRWNTFLLAAIP